MATDNEKKTLDYGAFLADLEAKRSALDQAIASLRAVMAAGTAEGIAFVKTATTLVNPDIHGGEVPAGAFLAKSIPDATRLYLSIVKQKQTTREIAEALQKGGMETTSKNNFEGIVAAGLNRVRKVSGDIVRVGRAWALAEWYPSGIRAASKEKRKVRKSKKLRPKEQTPKAESKPQTAATPVEGAKPKELILQFLRNQPGMELTTQELALRLGMKQPVVQMLLGTMVKNNIVAKLPTGKYRVAA